MPEVKKVSKRKQELINVDPSEAFTVRSHSYVYADLLTAYGDDLARGFKLIAVYATLLHTRNHLDSHRVITHKSNGRKTANYNLLSRNTKLSIKTLKKYVPKLIEKSLCYFTDSGSFILVGKGTLQKFKKGFFANKYENEFKGCSPLKLVPIKIGSKLSETTLNCQKVVIYSEERKQLYVSAKKGKLKDIKSRMSSENGKVSKSEIKMLERAVKDGFSVANHVKYPVLSIQGICDLFHGKSNIDYNSRKNKGSYLRKKFKRALIFETRRRFDSLYAKPMSKAQFLALRQVYAKNGVTNLFYRKGYAIQEIVSEFNILKSTLQFDSITNTYSILYSIPKFTNTK